MAAPDLPTLYKFENEFESAAVTFLSTAVGITINSTITEDDLTVPRIDIRLDVGEALDPPDKRGGGASPSTVDYRAYNGTFTAFVITDNAVGQAGDHATYRAKVRQALMRSGTNWDNTTLPYYDLKYLRPSGESYSTDGDFNITEMTFTLIFEIRANAWPT